MIVSLNDITSAVRRAVWGARVPFGVADDAGRSAEALARCGIEPLAAFIAGIEMLAADRSGMIALRHTGESCTLTAADSAGSASALYAGPSACDLLIAGRAASVIIEPADVPLLVAAAATLASQTHATTFRIEPGDGSSRWCFECTSGSFRATAGAPELALTPESVVIQGVAADSTAAPPTATPENVEVDTDHWRRIYELGKHALVPATAESRAHGAGAGLRDSD